MIRDDFYSSYLKILHRVNKSIKIEWVFPPFGRDYAGSEYPNNGKYEGNQVQQLDAVLESIGKVESLTLIDFDVRQIPHNVPLVQDRMAVID